MEKETPAELPVSEENQVQATPILTSTGQPIMYQMPMGQVQPVFVPIPAGQPTTTPDGQPIQYFYVPAGQAMPQSQNWGGVPVQPGQFVQPVFMQAPVGSVHPGQPVKNQDRPEQHAVAGQQPIQTSSGQPVQQSQRPAALGLDLNIDMDFLKSPLCFVRLGEFVSLLCAWASYLSLRSTSLMGSSGAFFIGVAIFSWLMVLIYLILYVFSLPKMYTRHTSNVTRPSVLTIASVIFFFILFTLMLACTGNLFTAAVVLPNVDALYASLTFGLLSCILFAVDVVLNYRIFQDQRDHEESPQDQGAQETAQRRVWDINHEYLRTAGFKIKFVEMAFLFGAWICISVYLTPFKFYLLSTSKADFFQGITVFSWIMVILIDLTFVLSFDKICRRSSRWTLGVLISYVVLSILLIASCGNLTSLAVALGNVSSPFVSLFIGLTFGYLSWVIFIVDIVLMYSMFKQQIAQELFHAQAVVNAQPVVQQPCVVIMSEGTSQQQSYQPIAHPGQQPSPEQGPVVIESSPIYQNVLEPEFSKT
ncbi:uncharacterized protein LOC114960832 [Acropora millepora]|uniref:uncharacterized protein LOC114960832 n=1 Tax=Acropora millepora TaxID=45264 RepID=UPI001CF2F151|nr:uncharacterized protein LOC114960832 [Acropora millepora]